MPAQMLRSGGKGQLQTLPELLPSYSPHCQEFSLPSLKIILKLWEKQDAWQEQPCSHATASPPIFPHICGATLRRASSSRPGDGWEGHARPCSPGSRHLGEGPFSSLGKGGVPRAMLQPAPGGTGIAPAVAMEAPYRIVSWSRLSCLNRRCRCSICSEVTVGGKERDDGGVSSLGTGQPPGGPICRAHVLLRDSRSLVGMKTCCKAGDTSKAHPVWQQPKCCLLPHPPRSGAGPWAHLGTVIPIPVSLWWLCAAVLSLAHCRGGDAKGALSPVLAPSAWHSTAGSHPPASSLGSLVTDPSNRPDSLIWGLLAPWAGPVAREQVLTCSRTSLQLGGSCAHVHSHAR